MNDNEYTCDACGGVFEDSEDWSEELAAAEFEEVFPGSSLNDSKVVCPACYAVITGQIGRAHV